MYHGRRAEQLDGAGEDANAAGESGEGTVSEALEVAQQALRYEEGRLRPGGRGFICVSVHIHSCTTHVHVHANAPQLTPQDLSHLHAQAALDRCPVLSRCLDCEGGYKTHVCSGYVRSG